MDWDVVVEKMERTLCKFCPVCGKYLIVDKKIIGSGVFAKAFDVKACPDEHGQMSVGFDGGGPNLQFDVAEGLWRT